MFFIRNIRRLRARNNIIGIAPGTPWEEVAESFECPICGLGKDAFEVEE
ncbi:MAG: rubredoxin [Clostridia bacterium]|nr:rubredoxin [Clostridia bacterium]